MCIRITCLKGRHKSIAYVFVARVVCDCNWILSVTYELVLVEMEEHTGYTGDEHGRELG
jgi:hypothetical protein